MSRLRVLLILPLLLAGCSSFGTKGSIWALIENTSQMQPKLSVYERGKRDLQLGSIGLAIDAFQTELRQNPNSIPALNGLAIAFDRLGRSDIAQQYLDQALALDRNSAITLNNLAYLNLTQGKTAIALAYGARAQAVASSKTEMQVPSSIASAVSKNIELASELAASEAREMVSKETLQAPEIDIGVERVGSNEWQLHTPVRGSSEVQNAVPPAPPIRMDESKGAAWNAPVPAAIMVRVSNGTGRHLMATRFGSYFSAHGLRVNQIANAASYNYTQTVIFYNPDQYDFALDLTRVLPFPIKLAKATRGSGQIEIILGSDLLTFDEDLRQGDA